MKNTMIGNNIKWKRESLGITQSEMAKLLKISNVTLSTWETGRTLPKPEAIDRICQILGCRKEEILGLHYEGRNADIQRRKLNDFFDDLSEDNRHLLLVRAKELVNIEAEQHGYYKKNAS